MNKLTTHSIDLLNNEQQLFIKCDDKFIAELRSGDYKKDIEYAHALVTRYNEYDKLKEEIDILKYKLRYIQNHYLPKG